MSTHGYEVSPGFAAPYLENNWSFLAAKVRSDQEKRELAPLEIQLAAFDVPGTVLPMEIAAESFREDQRSIYIDIDFTIEVKANVRLEEVWGCLV